MGRAFLGMLFRWLGAHRLGRGTRAALLSGIVPGRALPADIAGRSDRLWSRDGEVIHASLQWLCAKDFVRSMIVVITTRK